MVLIGGTLIARLRIIDDEWSDMYPTRQQLFQGWCFGADVYGRFRCTTRSLDLQLDHVVSILLLIARRLSIVVVVAALLNFDQIVQMFDHVPRLAMVVGIVQSLLEIPQVFLRQLLRQRLRGLVFRVRINVIFLSVILRLSINFENPGLCLETGVLVNAQPRYRSSGCCGSHAVAGREPIRQIYQ